MKYYIFLLLCYYVSANPVPTFNDEDTELVLVHVIFRHGARTTTTFYPNDPYKNETFYPIGRGGLTNEGKMGEYKLGQYLKTLYGDFLGEDYTEDKVYVRSSDVTRTKMSAQLVLAALFPPSEIQTWNKDLSWQPIPVDYVNQLQEDLFHREICPFKVLKMLELSQSEIFKEVYVKPFKETYEYIQEHSGQHVGGPTELELLYFNLKTEQDMNYTLPEWTKSVFPEPMATISSLVYGSHNLDPEVRQINSGFLLKKILDDTIAKTTGNPSEKKIFLYSGHELTVGYMLSALKLTEPLIPSYGSAISFEVHKKNDEYFFKMRYRDDPDATEPIDLIVPGCDLLCPISKFAALYQELIPTMTVDEMCNRL